MQGGLETLHGLKRSHAPFPSFTSHARYRTCSCYPAAVIPEMRRSFGQLHALPGTAVSCACGPGEVTQTLQAAAASSEAASSNATFMRVKEAMHKDTRSHRPYASLTGTRAVVVHHRPGMGSIVPHKNISSMSNPQDLGL